MTMPHRASCVAIDGRGMLIEGPPGSGKSSLALALIDRGAVLVGDDGVLLSEENGRLHAAPHPNIRGLIEVRNVGLVEMPSAERTPVCLVIALDPAAPRHIDAADSVERLGLTLPFVRLWPESPVLALRAELALERYGLPR